MNYQSQCSEKELFATSGQHIWQIDIVFYTATSQVNEGNSSREEERVRAIGALRSLQSKQKLVAEKRYETHIVSNEEKDK